MSLPVYLFSNLPKMMRRRETDIEKIATIVNSDMIPFRKRGMYQALQNGMFGFGAVAGASFGGSIADHIGWRWCFLLQVPVSIMALALGALVIKNPEGGFDIDTNDWRAIWSRVDVSGALLLVVAISVQLVGLSLGGNELPWGSSIVIGTLVGSVLLLALFVLVEARTKAIPVIPLRMLRGKLPILTQISNVCAGLAAYAVCRPYTDTLSITRNFGFMIADMTATIVPFHASALLPGSVARFGDQSRRKISDSITCYASRGSVCGYRHVSLGQAHLARPRWRVPDAVWQFTRHCPPISRLAVEISRLHLSSESGSGYHLPGNSLHDFSLV